MKKDLPQTSVPEPQASEEKKNPAKNQYLEIRIPRFSLKSGGVNKVLVIVLVIFAFLLGMLFNKVLYLEKQLKDQAAQKKVEAAQINNNANNQPANNAPAYPTPLPKVDGITAGHLPVLGDNNAKVTVVEFSDFQCPFCKQFEDNTYQQVYNTYIKTGKVKFAYRYFPLTSIHPNSEKASEAADCANDQGKFWDYHDLLFKNQADWSPQAAADAETSFINYAGQLGLDTDAFKTCLDTDKDKANVDNDTADGTKAQVDGTPTFFINGWRLVGAQPFAQLQTLIEKELKK